MKLLAAVLLALSCIGCSSTCADGSGSFLVWERGNYKACGMECAKSDGGVGALGGARAGERTGQMMAGEDVAHSSEKCGCSAQCPCWKKHQ